jgi:hypothetical protein
MLFAAVAAIDSPQGFPADTPYTFQPIAVETFTPATGSVDTIVPFATVLEPGDYSIIIGSNLFGASGKGYMDFMSGDIGQPSYFKGDTGNIFHIGATWHENPGPNFHNIRFVVNGIVVPEPSTAALLVIGCVVALVVRRR